MAKISNHKKTQMIKIKWNEMIDFIWTKKPMILTSILRIFTISAGSMLQMSFKLMSCVSIKSNIYHLYSTQHVCTDGYFFLGLICILVIISIFCAVFYRIYKTDKLIRNDPTKNKYYKLISPFYLFYWELVLFSRRFFVSLVTSTVLNSSNDDTTYISDYMLLIILIAYLAHHSYKRPYKYSRLNILDAVCLSSLILISVLVQQHNVFNHYFVSLSILFPIIVYLFYFVRIIFFICKSYKDQKNFNKKDLEKIKTIQKRSERLFNLDLNKIIVKNTANNKNADDKLDIIYDMNDNDENEMKIQTTNVKDIEMEKITQKKQLSNKEKNKTDVQDENEENVLEHVDVKKINELFESDHSKTIDDCLRENTDSDNW
eukprot:471917_1